MQTNVSKIEPNVLELSQNTNNIFLSKPEDVDFPANSFSVTKKIALWSNANPKYSDWVKAKTSANLQEKKRRKDK